jgi:hypothetical protein
MKVIKLTTPWGHSFIRDQLNPRITKYKFEIDNSCDICDYWVVWGDLPPGVEKMSVKCRPGNVIFMTDEAQPKKTFSQAFLNQFDYLITCRADINHLNLIKTHEINHWHLNKSFLEVDNTTKVNKTKMLSVVSSDLTILEGHKKRFALINRLIGHFKDKLDVYGRGFNPVDDKWEALAPYKYSIAIENSSLPGYFTEKITECYLAHTLPVYYGAPNITAYFDPKSLLKIDIDDYRSAIDLIEQLIDEDPWEQVEETLIAQKLLYLNKYHLFPALAGIIDKITPSDGTYKNCTLYAAETYYQYYRIRKAWQGWKRHFNK